MKTKLFVVVPLLVLAAMGCNRGTEATPGAPAKLKLVYIPKSSGNAYFDQVDQGFKDAQKELGFEYAMTAPSSSDATSQLSIIKDQVQRGVDVIAISPNSPDALNSALDEAKSKGITVITVDADLVGNEGHRDAAVLPADFSLIGTSQVELLGKLTGYQGDVAIISATADAPNQNAWIATMKTTLAQPKYAKMKLVTIVYGDDEQQKSTTECEALLAKYPNLRGIISPTSVGLAAAAPVIERTGVFPKGPHAAGSGLELTGLSTPNQLRKFVKDGSVTAFQLWAPSKEGYLAAYLAQQIRDKKLTPASGASIKTPKLGETKFSPKLELIAGPLITFDKSNIDQYNF